MVDYVTKIRTESGDLEIDYNALANKPKFDITLTEAGQIADAKATGSAINTAKTQLSEQITQTSETLRSEITELDASVIKSINNLTPGDDGSITIKPSDIGAIDSSDSSQFVGGIGGLTGDIGVTDGLAVSGNSIVNSGVRSVTTGSSNGTISVNTNGTAANVAVKGLGSAAYTDSATYVTKAMIWKDGTILYIKTNMEV